MIIPFWFLAVAVLVAFIGGYYLGAFVGRREHLSPSQRT